jgi:CotS family spore coat protein
MENKWEDKLEEIIKQYPFQVYSRKRVRGAFWLETDKGLRLLRECNLSQARILFEEKIKAKLQEQGYQDVDFFCKNSREEYVTRDIYRNQWCVQWWYPGEQCDIKQRESVLRAATHLGKLHRLLRLGGCGEEDYIQKESVRQEMERHNRELKRVRSYIRGKKQKNETEICLLNSFDLFYGQACLAETLLQESGYEQLWERTVQQGRVCHGSYTYHNLLFYGSRTITTNFDKAEVGIQIRDLYDFLRKVMEKNGWEGEIGLDVLSAYGKERSLEKEEQILLYAMLLYPEKYWKLVNFYYNSRKSWISSRNLEKLIRIRAQEENRADFLKELKGVFNV